MDNTTTLKPCPFCGGENPKLRMTASGENWHIVCDECGGQSGICGTSAPVVERWNTRPTEQALLEALADVLELADFKGCDLAESAARARALIAAAS